jgi:hypothetical protein
MLIIILLSLLNIGFSQCVNNTIKCTDCQKTCCAEAFNQMKSCSCYCTNGCNDFRDIPTDKWYCVKKTLDEPTLILPQCKNTVECNYYGSGVHCPNDCYMYNGECVSDTNALCKPRVGLSCPDGCSYTKATNSCYPMSSNTVCSFIEKNLLCPNMCSYNGNLNKCVSFDPNYVCDLEQTLQCPNNCHLNQDGNKCIGNTLSTLCHYEPKPHCPFGCEFSKNTGYCEPTTSSYNGMCETIAELSCPFGQYNIDLREMKPCTVGNQHDICYTDTTYTLDHWIYPIIHYPIRYHGKFEHIKCIIDRDMSCDHSRMECTRM